ncbi:amidase [Streptomyces sp. PTM05]|uniref:Amidase n=1 Tax=Streptantibioticus parmotrematis TaxID=2873249 RepID=A0ABS7QYI0_9ACTN|nr:amidase [Streptantibioticus parmotrematis]MBY8888268.1 amidase [Streptantibioticus parmotrematis]
MDDLVRSRPLLEETRALRAGGEAVLASAARTCDRIDAVDPLIEAFVPEPGRRERVTARARELAERWPDPAERPALYGVTVGVKDVAHVDGLPTHGGSALPATELTGRQAEVVDRLLAAGAVVAGKTVTAEFAIAAPGPTRNPHHPEYAPGGSSSGSAAAVAAGMVPLAIGTQTVGSTIRPAAYCGVVGYRPGHDRAMTDGMIANAPTLDTVGFFAARVADVAYAAGALYDDWRPTDGDGPAPVLGVPAGAYLRRTEPVALDAFGAQVKALREAGLTVREVPLLDDFDEIRAQLFTVNRYETAQVHAEWFERHGGLYREQSARAVREGRAVEPERYEAALRWRTAFRERLESVMADEGVGMWITPSATGPAPHGLERTGDPAMCVPWSLAGMPAVNVPAGRTAEGLPLGVQCVAGVGSDEHLLTWAQPVESALR